MNWVQNFVAKYILPEQKPQQTIEASSSFTTSRVIYAGSFDGEKNLGEFGPPKDLLMDYEILSMRAWQAYMESAECQTIINKYCTWVVGEGLKLKCEPEDDLIGINLQEFSKEVEIRFKLYANSRHADYSGQTTLNQLEFAGFKQALNGGDVLVVLRYIDDCVKVQLIDGAHLASPMSGSEWFPGIAENGNRIINGVEIDKKGMHVAYHVKKLTDGVSPMVGIETERIPARGKKSGELMAYLVYGHKYRLDNQRGIPLVSAVLEKLKTLDRYQQATLASAEEQAKINFQVVHQPGSSGEFPFTKQAAAAFDASRKSDLPVTEQGEQLANKVYVTTNKQTVNNPVGAEVKPLKSNEAQLYFKDYNSGNTDIICAAIEMPPNVAMSKYDSNYSASRAAIKDWENTLRVKRNYFATQFIKPIYCFWLETEILKNSIQAPGYLLAKSKGDYMLIEAYRNCRFIGAPVANIDPAKEVQAERLKLGITGESIPLTTVEAATEILNGGDSVHNMEQYSEELELSKALGLKPEPEVKQVSNVSDK